MRWRVLLAVAVLVGGLGLGGAAQDDKKADPKDAKKPTPMAQEDAKALSRLELDRRIAKIAYDGLEAGVNQWNANNPEGCFRIFQATLMAVVPFLDHRPKLAAYAKGHLEQAAKLDNIKGSVVLREALDAVKNETHAATLPPKKTLWERLGEEKGVRAVVKDFLALAVKDETLDATRGGKFKWDAKAVGEAENVIVDMVREYAGGPPKPTIPNLRAILPGTNVTDAEFDKLQKHLYDAMEKNKVGTEEMREVLQIFRSIRPVVVGK